MENRVVEDGRNPIFFLFLFSLILGCELGSLSQHLDSYGSIILVEPLLTLGNLIWLYFAGLFIFFSFKENIRMLKIAYFLGGISFLFTESVINAIEYKPLYGVKILILFAATGLLLIYLHKIIKQYKALSSGNTEDNA